jgi:hypothetical protein
VATAQVAVETTRELAGPHSEVPAGSGGHRVTCVFHCAAPGCGRHFASLEAFDLHLGGPLEARVCTPPEQVTGKKPRHRLVEKATDAICAIGGQGEVHGVTVWQTEAARDAGSRPS